MTTAQLVDIQNTAEMERKILHNKRIEILYPYEIRAVSRDLAAAFISSYPRDVIYYVPVKVPVPASGERVIWLANVTGNPFSPNEVIEARITKGVREEFKVVNPNKKATPVKSMMGVGQIWQKNPLSGEEECLNLPKMLIEIPPYARIRCGHTVGEWLINRDAMNTPAHRGKIIVCNEPGDCEPNDSWPLDEIRSFASFVDGETFVRNHPEFGDVLGPTEEELKGDEAGLIGAKSALLRKLFFRVVDPRYGKPSRRQWDEIKEALKVKESGPKRPVSIGAKFGTIQQTAPSGGA